ncbi:SH3 domain-containing protein [Kordia sp. YSTF-M3]|uniref:SH3 domain-containing protein n=1 Tax=Kordia aestuariivivens TaxID=2759037 RepID=A0ABR7QBF6_9FLAO|nr:SH3 domain-containing protein [Kordia aestuariivivens]MBC8755906.1 SH3 domain-containing protein [Kordia aestuariivivens]
MLSQAQNDTTYLYHKYDIDKTYSLFGDNVKLRAEPNTTSEVVTLLRIGDEVKIIKKTYFFLEDATSKTAWYEVDFQGEKGFIAGKFIANGHKKSGNQHFYFRKIPDEENDQVHIRIVYNTTTKAYTETTQKLMNESIGISFEAHHDLKNILQIVIINYFGDSCGEEGGNTVLFLKENYELVKVADLSEIGDGGIYGLSETFTYKIDEENGQPIILFTKEEEEQVDEEKRWFETKKITRIYEWNGTKLVPEFSKEFKKRETSN